MGKAFEREDPAGYRYRVAGGWRIGICPDCGATYNAGQPSNGPGVRYVHATLDAWFAAHKGNLRVGQGFQVGDVAICPIVRVERRPHPELFGPMPPAGQLIMTCPWNYGFRIVGRCPEDQDRCPIYFDHSRIAEVNKCAADVRSATKEP